MNADEIYDQVVLIAKQSQDFYKRPLTNIVFMGMGEPLMNYKNVTKAIEMITSNEGSWNVLKENSSFNFRSTKNDKKNGR